MNSKSKPVIIYVLCYNNITFQKSLVYYKKYTWAVPIIMKYQTLAFENSFWKQLQEIHSEWAHCAMVGTIAHSAMNKINLSEMDKIIQSNQHPYYHFANTTMMIPNVNTKFHPYFNQIWFDVLDTLHLRNVSENNFNYWMCTPNLMLKFISWYQHKCMPALMAHPLIMTNSKHGGTLTENELYTLCGVPYYPHYPFIAERIHKSFFTSPQKKTLCIVACHTSNELKIEALLASRPYLKEISDDIIYINSSEFKSRFIIKNMCYIPNTRELCYSKFAHVLSNVDLNKYDNFILTNDSIVFINSLLPFQSLFHEQCEMTSLVASNEVHYHYPDFLRRYNKSGIQKILKLYATIPPNLSVAQLIQTVETKCHHINTSINLLYPAINDYAKNIHFDDSKLMHYIHELNYPILKLKCIANKIVYPGIPPDFIPSIYKNIHTDLIHMSDNEAHAHFIKHGMSEGRLYKLNQIKSEKLRDILSVYNIKTYMLI